MTLEQALQLHRDGQLDAAEQGYREHLAQAPDDPEGLHLLGVLEQQRGNIPAALELLRRALTLAPEYVPLHLALGGTLLRAGEADAARASFERALELDPNSPQAYTLLGHLALQDGDIANAESRFRVGRRVEENDPLILFGLGNVYLARGDATNAAKFLAAAAERRPDDPAIQTSFGQALFDQGAFGLAEKAFENALRLRPDLSIARLYLARSRLRQTKLDGARDEFSLLLADNLQAFGANAGLGDVARRQGQTVKALKFYRRALALDPLHPGVINACAWCMEKLGDLVAAAQYLAEGLARNPQADELRRPLAELLDRLGRKDEAQRVRLASAAAS